jgi:hypothetical protein
MARYTHKYLKGKVKWFRPYTVDQFGKWNHVLYPDADSLEVIRDLQGKGAKNSVKKDEDGWYLNISRPEQKVYEFPNGQKKVIDFAAPVIVNSENQPWPRDLAVGNGSEVTTKIEIYEHGTPGGGKAHAFRWAGTRIENHIPWEKEKDFKPDEEKAVKGLIDQPSPSKEIF